MVMFWLTLLNIVSQPRCATTKRFLTWLYDERMILLCIQIYAYVSMDYPDSSGYTLLYLTFRTNVRPHQGIDKLMLTCMT